MSNLLATIGTVATWLLAQLKITAANIGDIAAALGHVNVTWLIHPVVAAVVIWVLIKIARKVTK